MYTLTPNDRIILIVILATLAIIGAIVSTILAIALEKAKKRIKGDAVWKDMADDLIKELQKSFSELTTEHNEKKKLFEDETRIAYERIQVMQTGLKEYHEEIKQLNAKLSRKNQPRDSQGHFVKVKPVESEWWKCISNEYSQFTEGLNYKQDKSVNSSDGFLWLLEHEDYLHPCLVEKKYFKPIICK